jgi:hypothetical protein
MLGLRVGGFILVGTLLSFSTSAGTWTESRDAASSTDGAAQASTSPIPQRSLSAETGDDERRLGDEGQDATGESGANGPARELEKRRPEARPGENMPSKQETDQAFARVLARIEGEIAAARAEEDSSETRRLQVRQERLKRLRVAKMAEDPSETIARKPGKRPAKPPRGLEVEGVELPSAPALELGERSQSGIAGRMRLEGLSVDFGVRRTSEQVFALEIRFGDVTLTGELDYAKEVFLLDGFASETGEDVVLDERALVVVEGLGMALASARVDGPYRPDVKNMRGVVHQTPGSALSRLLAVWQTSGLGNVPENYIKAVQGSSIDYLCGWLTGFGIQATHDCWDCWNRWDGWSYVNIGPQGSYNCYPDSCSSACSNYNAIRCGRLSCEQSGGGRNGTWQWGSNGDKYGACTVWDTNAYTRDCLYHDHCTRNDHSSASGWCSDEATRAIDDQISAKDCIMMNGCTASCGGYNAIRGCWCDSACEGYGDCCMDKVQKCG